MTRRAGPIFAVLILPLVLLSACSGPANERGENERETGSLKVARLPMRTDGPKSLDPADGATVYDNRCCSLVYETLLQYKYLVRPPQLEPLLLTEMPSVSEDGLTYHFALKPGVLFHDDPCFPDGKGREMVSSDVFYSWKRLADSDVSPKNWWLMEDTIVGLDAYREQQSSAATFDYDAPVEGLKIVNDHEFKVVLKKRVQRFLWTLAMFQLSVVPREAVEAYGDRFEHRPIGTGPYTVAEEDWVPGQNIVFHRNPKYHSCTYPEEHMPEDQSFGFHEPAGTPLPIIDRVEITFFVNDQPMWLQFRSGNLDYTQVPAENFVEAFNKRTKKLQSKFQKEGIVGHQVPLLDFIYFGFNMEDEVLGGYDDKKKYLRQAISLALDWDERNDAFYNSTNVVYDGMIPPGLAGHPEGGKTPVNYRGPDIQRARELLAKAGHPNGKGLPKINYYTSRGGNVPEQTEMTMRQLKNIGVNINPRLVDFSTLSESLHNKVAPFFSLAWSSDYPDGENNLALFYGPNGSPGSNSFNYKREEFDAMYEEIRVMPPSDERTAIMQKMRDMVIEDSAFIGSMARTRSYLVSPRLKNFKPTEDFYNWVKYLDIDDSAKRG